MSSMQGVESPIENYYRRVMEGHVYIQDTVDALLDTVVCRLPTLGERPRVLELGSHSGVITEALLQRRPGLDILVHEPDPELLELAQRRLAGRRVTFHTAPLSELTETVELVVSVARHHHLPHDYLPQVRRVLAPHGVYAMADELCPEYCQGEDAARIEQAQLIHVAGGYVLTSRAEVVQFEREREIPPRAREVERLRQRALWRWYRFVVDQAVERGYFDIASSELQSTLDDWITGSAAEHKFSPRIVERQLELAGFQRLSRRMIGPEDDPERQSMFVYEFGAAPGGVGATDVADGLSG